MYIIAVLISIFYDHKGFFVLVLLTDLVLVSTL